MQKQVRKKSEAMPPGHFERYPSLIVAQQKHEREQCNCPDVKLSARSKTETLGDWNTWSPTSDQRLNIGNKADALELMA
jgi:hypothetical protein